MPKLYLPLNVKTANAPKRWTPVCCRRLICSLRSIYYSLAAYSSATTVPRWHHNSGSGNTFFWKAICEICKVYLSRQYWGWSFVYPGKTNTSLKIKDFCKEGVAKQVLIERVIWIQWRLRSDPIEEILYYGFDVCPSDSLVANVFSC